MAKHTDSMNIAVIPARGGSKRIANKNIRPFCGKPMIAWSIGAALTSGLFDRVIVSTDSEEIAQIALSYGAEVPFIRPTELSTDYCGTKSVRQGHLSIGSAASMRLHLSSVKMI